MKHEIETEGASNYAADCNRVSKIILSVEALHPDCRIRSNTDRMKIRIEANCGGAALRDLVTALDHEGFL